MEIKIKPSFHLELFNQVENNFFLRENNDGGDK